MVDSGTVTARRGITVLDAPSNLGLRPPDEGALPGCYKLPWALRNRGLLSMLRARDAGTVIPPRYYATWQPGDGDRNAEAIANFSRELAKRVGQIVDREELPLVLGGDCSILLGNMLALKKRGRFGLVFFDAHSDFRHPKNSEAIGAAAGEDLAIVSGRGDSRLVNLDNLGPYVTDEDVVLVGIRQDDVYLDELAAHSISVYTSHDVLHLGPEEVATQALQVATEETDGFWVHLDFDVVDSSEMSAVDSPAPDGLSFARLGGVLRPIVASPHCIGIEVTIYDPDLDPEGTQADAIIRFLQSVFSGD